MFIFKRIGDIFLPYGYSAIDFVYMVVSSLVVETAFF